MICIQRWTICYSGQVGINCTRRTLSSLKLSLDPDGGVLGSTGDLRPRHSDDPYTVVDIPLFYMLKTLVTYPKPPPRSSVDPSTTGATAGTAAFTTRQATGGDTEAVAASTVSDLQLRTLAGLNPGILNAAARQANRSTEGTEEEEDGRTEYRRMPGGYTRPST